MQRRQLLALACSFLLIQSSSWALAEELAKPVPTKPVPVQQIRLVDDLVCGSAFDSGYRKSGLDAAKANRKKRQNAGSGGSLP